jgi:predicted NBD/HSP70 family sugar kinase
MRSHLPQLRGFRAQPAFAAPNDSERRLLGLLLRSGSMSQAEVTRVMDLTQPTVSRIVAGLLAKGMIEAGARPAVGRGQPSALLSLKADYAYALGISLVGGALAMDLVDFSGALLWRDEAAFEDMSPEAVGTTLSRFKARAIAETSVDGARLFAAGAGVSGFFVGEGPLMNTPALLDDWALVDIAPVLAQVLDLPVLVDNDGNAAAIGEALRGAGLRYANLAYFQITNGFGGGVVIDGRPFRGAHGNAGEFAVLWQALGLEHPNLERLRTLLVAHGAPRGSLAGMLAELDLNHPGTEAWLAEAVTAYSLAAAAASAVIDCEAIILGGEIPSALAARLAERMTIAGTQRRGRPKPLPVILPSEAPGDAVSLGAAFLALQTTFFG